MAENSILIVEDNENEALLISLSLKKHTALKVLWRASNGEEAIDYLSGTGTFADRDRYPLPDAVLLDLKMPGLSGFDVLEWLHCQALHPYVIVFTASLDDTDRIRSLESGADHFITKPVGLRELEEFVKLLERWVAERVSSKDQPRR